MKNICAVLLSLLCMSSVRSADVPESDPEQAKDDKISVARVNNQALTLKKLERELLRQEGSYKIEAMVREHLKTIDWDKVHDHDTVLSIYGLDIPRVLIASKLLDEFGADVREELIQTMMVNQALHKAGIIFDQKLKDEMIKRMERRHYAMQEAKGGDTTVPFESVIQQTYNMTPEEWQEDQGFNLLAGTYALMYKTMDVPEAELREYFQDHLRRYGLAEAYQLTVIPMAFKIDAQFMVTEASKQRMRKTAKQHFDNINSQRRSFKQVVKIYEADFKGDRGYVTRDGRAEVKGVARVPRQVMEAVFRHQYSEFPTLIGPIESTGYVTIVRVESYRKGVRADFEKCRQQVKMDLIDSDAQRWIASFLRELRNNSEIEYGSLLDIMANRRQDVQKYIEIQKTESTTIDIHK
ncbi:MAG: peptidyl-prolyl cis-trans isomerase [Planctomycetes bacterium]|nr:peptidyl-prolyl cis-trans isomerase [Planctomycetota bacterium]